MFSWVIKLVRDSGDWGYYLTSDERGILRTKNPLLAHRFDDEDYAELVLERLVRDHNLDLEEGKIEQLADDDVGAVYLDEKRTTGLAVLRDESGNHDLFASFGGVEVTADLPDEVSDVVTKVLLAIQDRLRRRKGGTEPDCKGMP
jgi:hypothetical protein